MVETRYCADGGLPEHSADAYIRPITPDRMKSGKRIDGIVAAIMARRRTVVGDDNVISDSGVRSVA
jgi:hypothetical protein